MKDKSRLSDRKLEVTHLQTASVNTLKKNTSFKNMSKFPGQLKYGPPESPLRA